MTKLYSALMIHSCFEDSSLNFNIHHLRFLKPEVARWEGGADLNTSCLVSTVYLQAMVKCEYANAHANFCITFRQNVMNMWFLKEIL